MNNQYFQFKQFRIEQERCAMKVTTDACMQGAWTPVLPDVKRVLDIGAGTGLLSLMLAQRNGSITIDAIEYDPMAAGQARENVDASPWKERINIIEGDVCRHSFDGKYDLIISNPPFFNNSLLSDDADKNRARHTVSLTYDSLLKVIDENLAEGGCASVMLPYNEYLLWKGLLNDGKWHEVGRLYVSHRPGAAVKRVVCIFGKKEADSLTEESLIIYDEEHQCSQGFIKLLSPYYLNL